jgi:hypothetical protein
MKQETILLIFAFGLEMLLEVWKKLLERWSRSSENLGYQVAI